MFAFAVLQGQTIGFDFSHFGGQGFVVSVVRGEKTDTVYSGTLDKQGKASFAVPAAYRNHTGIAHWLLTNGSGGGFSFVLNGEQNVTFRCTEAVPSEKTIEYINSPENAFMYGQYIRQNDVINKAAACDGVLRGYECEEFEKFEDAKALNDCKAFRDLAAAEMQRLENTFTDIQRGIRQSPLYGARIREYSDYLSFTGSRLRLTEAEIRAERRDFFENRLDLRQLYYSGFWKDLIAAHIGSVAENDSLLLSDSRLLLARAAADREMSENLLYGLTLLYHKYGKENLLSELGVDDLVSAGRLAPMLRLQNKYIRPLNSVVVFYETGCNACDNEMMQLQGNYEVLKAEGLEVISVAADRDEKVFAENAVLFPWSEKYCDYEGFAGENFHRYDVKGTPTFFLTDGEGKITGRWASLGEVMTKIFEERETTLY